ncbi:agamous-like MADS-box protein AGL62 [Momordica charantia]|uniref:Agamous-like MADS-box protein AGL62 n=1 Tax=Momordica charantia TaxID=3673 RepID=A0A6J1DSH0_MOMCH|nr:agamous-like MADS-box protein AGL62 [Momordica charantia]
MKKTLGRQKIEIKKLEKKSSKQVTFSKRRTGLFKKAAELSVLCGVDIAIVVFSPNGKVFSFGHPNVDVLFDRFLTGNLAPPQPVERYVPVEELNREFADAERELEVQKRRAAEESRSSGGFWWEEPMEGMRLEELKEFRSALQDLRAKVEERVEKLTAVRIGGPLSPPPATPFHLAGNHQFPPPTKSSQFLPLSPPLPPPPATSFHLAGNHQFPPPPPTTPFRLAGGRGRLPLTAPFNLAANCQCLPPPLMMPFHLAGNQDVATALEFFLA